MIARRLLTYFLLVVAFAVVATLCFEIYSLKKAADRTIHSYSLYSQSVSKFVGGVLENEARHLSEVLGSFISSIEADTPRSSRGGTAKNLPRDPRVIIFGPHKNIVAAGSRNTPLAPAPILLPLLRQIETGAKFAVSDLWMDWQGRPRIALAVGNRFEGRWFWALLPMGLDSREFQGLFQYFMADERTRVQLLDSRGNAVFSTKADERYAPVVHGTYFSDKMRLGQPVVMQCHSCHEGKRSTERTKEIITVAPVPGTMWSVSYRGSMDEVFSPIRDVAFSYVAFVSLMLGSFIGFFVLVSKKIIQPIRNLSKIAIRMTSEKSGLRLPDTAINDEFAVLTDAVQRLDQTNDEEAADDAAASVHELEQLIGNTTNGADDLKRGIEDALESAFASIIGVEPVHAVAVVIQKSGPWPEVLWTKGVQLRSERPLAKVLRRLAERRSSISMQNMKEADVLVDAERELKGFLVEKMSLLEIESGHKITERRVRHSVGHIWIGVDLPPDEISPYFSHVLNLINAHVQHLLVRTVLYNQLKREHGQKTQMLRHVLQAEDEERQRIAREIHDETAQVLTALLVLLETFPAPDKPERQGEQITRAKEFVSQILQQAHRLIKRLRPAALEDLGLVEAVRSMAHNTLFGSGIVFEMVVDGGDEPILPKEVEVTVYRVIQEAVTNVLRHSKAENAKVSLYFGEASVAASVDDDGRGLNKTASGSNTRPKWGIMGMRERVEHLGGTIGFSRSSMGGLCVSLKVPIPRAGDE